MTLTYIYRPISYHAEERARERHGITASKEEWTQAVAVIEQGRAPVACFRVPPGHIARVVVIQGRSLAVSYDPARQVIVTVFPPDPTVTTNLGHLLKHHG